jgi:hypothetical protein
VPEPDISLHFLIQRLKILNHPLKVLIQRLIPAAACSSIPAILSSKMMGLVRFSEISPEMVWQRRTDCCFRLAFDYQSKPQ